MGLGRVDKMSHKNASRWITDDGCGRPLGDYVTRSRSKDSSTCMRSLLGRQTSYSSLDGGISDGRRTRRRQSIRSHYSYFLFGKIKRIIMQLLATHYFSRGNK